jgi:Fe-S cluster biogenesis protein NfuA
MEIRYEPTPNPATMKFLFGEAKMGEKNKLGESKPVRLLEFSSPQEAEVSPLAAKLFGFPWVSKIMLGEDFLALTKQDWVDWDVLCEPLADLIAEHLKLGQPLWLDLSGASDHSEISEDDPEIVKKIKLALDREIRPVVKMDGGDISFVKLEGEVLYIKMKGACSGCPSSTATLKEGIEVRMRELFKEIKEVVSIGS